MQEIFLREMIEEDIPMIYKELNEKYVEKYCTHEREEQWLAHEKWYKFILNSPFFLMYIVTNKENEILGSLKFEIHSEVAVINIFLVESARGKGWSCPLMEEGIKKVIAKHSDIETIEAYIIKENEISEHMVKKLGFEFKKNSNYHGMRHMLYVKKFPEKQYKIYYK